MVHIDMFHVVNKKEKNIQRQFTRRLANRVHANTVLINHTMSCAFYS